MKFDHTAFQDARTPLPLQQHKSFVAAVRAIGRKVDTLTLSGGGHAAVLRRKLWPVGTVSLVSRGPVWPDGGTQRQHYDALIQLRRSRVQLINNEAIAPETMRAAGYRQLVTPATIAELDLRDPTPLREAAMTAKWRNGLRKAERSGLKIVTRPFAHQSDKWVLDADRAQQKLRGYRAMPPAVTQAFALMNNGMAQIVTALKDGDPVAAMIFLRHGRAATYHIGWTSVAGRAANAHTLCLAKAAQHLADQGVARLDLGTIDTESLPGLARFKLGSGAQPRQLGGTWISLPVWRARKLA